MAFTNINAINMAKRARAIGNLDEAIKILEDAIKERQKNWFIKTDGDLRDLLGKIKEEKAESLYKKVKELTAALPKGLTPALSSQRYTLFEAKRLIEEVINLTGKSDLKSEAGLILKAITEKTDYIIKEEDRSKADNLFKEAVLSNERGDIIPAITKLEEMERLGFADEGSRSLYNNLLAKSIALPRNLTTFAGYELSGEIGRGAMGVVYKAIQPGTKRDVALKIFSPIDDIARDPRALSECRQRFIQEAEITASFSHPTEHPNIIFIYHFDHYQGKPFYAMQYLAETLDKRLGGDEEELAKGAASGKTLPVSDSLNIIEQVCKGLKTVHEKGIVHRDIKPQNILFNDSGIVKIGDFGIAKRLEGISFTKSTGGFASAFYAAPDQESGFKDVDYRADIYSVSAVLYRMVTGRLPRGGFKPPHQINPEFPKEKSEAVMKGLSENPAERFTTITAFIQSLGLVSAGAAAEHKREKYKIAVEMVLSDGAITADEEKLLKKKRI